MSTCDAAGSSAQATQPPAAGAANLGCTPTPHMCVARLQRWPAALVLFALWWRQTLSLLAVLRCCALLTLSHPTPCVRAQQARAAGR
jgi:hypothetical protein